MEGFGPIILHSLKQGALFLWALVVAQCVLTIAVGKRLFRLVVPKALKSLKGEIILITGAGNGIGRQIALSLGNLGAKLVCWDIESEANCKLVNELSKSGTKAYGYTVDISDMEAIREASKKVRHDVGEVTIVINNAGIVPNGPFMQMNSELEERMLRVNVLSHFQILREFLGEMIARNHGHIVTIASIASFFPAKQLAGYTACKHANYGFIESIKQELEDLPNDTSNIQFTTVYPCFVRTRLMHGVTLSPKFPSNFPVVTPEFAGEEIVKAIRRNEEHLYIPKRAATIPLLRALIPTEVKKNLQRSVFKIEVERSNLNNNY